MNELQETINLGVGFDFEYDINVTIHAQTRQHYYIGVLILKLFTHVRKVRGHALNIKN